MTGTNLSNTAPTHRLRILLQRSGFLRDSTEYIQRHASNDVRGTIDNQNLLKQALLHSPNELVRKDTKEIQYNIPEIFIDEGDLSMANFYETVVDVLKQDARFVAEDGTFLRNAVYEATMKMDAPLIKRLLGNEETAKRFFADVDGVKVFDKMGFAWVINNRQFLPDSYTRFKNKIGLMDEQEEMITASGKVELVFPYKDCVLEGGQTKEDQKRQEIFYNETLAPDEVDRLLYPKVLVNARRVHRGGGR